MELYLRTRATDCYTKQGNSLDNIFNFLVSYSISTTAGELDEFLITRLRYLIACVMIMINNFIRLIRIAYGFPNINNLFHLHDINCIMSNRRIITDIFP